MATALPGACCVIRDTRIKQIFLLTAKQLQIMKGDMAEYLERT